MRVGLARAAALFVLALGVTQPAWSDETPVWNALRSGAHVALMRHAEAPGVGDPPGWRLEDCATQRNLSAQGRADARDLGIRLRRERVLIGRVLSSPWCRCLDTARLLDLGRVEVEPAFANVFMLPERRTASAEQARTLISGWRGPGTLLVVTHAENIRDLTGQSPRSGEMVVVAPGRGGALRLIGSVLPAAAIGPPPTDPDRGTR